MYYDHAQFGLDWLQSKLNWKPADFADRGP